MLATSGQSGCLHVLLCACCIAALVCTTIGLSMKPDTSLQTWAKKEAIRRKQAGTFDDEQQ